MHLGMHGTYTYQVTYVELEARIPLGLGEFPLAPMNRRQAHMQARDGISGNYIASYHNANKLTRSRKLPNTAIIAKIFISS